MVPDLQSTVAVAESQDYSASGRQVLAHVQARTFGRTPRHRVLKQEDARHPCRIYSRQRGPREMKT